MRLHAPFGRRLAAVLRSSDLGRYRLLEVKDPGGPSPHAGQFYMLATASAWGGGGVEGRPFLSRAFSVCTVAEDQLGFLLEGVGPGTTRLGKCVAGEQLYLTGPLGNGFTVPQKLGGAKARPILVAGGVGVPPLAVWEGELIAAGVEPTVLAGFRDCEHLPGATLFRSAVRVATDSGEGKWPGGDVHSGLVTELLIEELEAGQSNVVYACGPPPMLEAVRAICAEREVPAELAMEAGMACGYGACFGCVVETKAGYKRLCVDGPVVDAAELTSALGPGQVAGGEVALGS